MPKSLCGRARACPVSISAQARSARFVINVYKTFVRETQQPILVLNKAHHLRNEVLEGVWLLTNHAVVSQNPLRMLILGLSELLRRLHDVSTRNTKSANSHAL